MSLECLFVQITRVYKSKLDFLTSEPTALVLENHGQLSSIFHDELSLNSLLALDLSQTLLNELTVQRVVGEES